MKNLVFAALLVGGLSQATGCIITSGDDDTVDTSAFQLTWNLQTAVSDPPGAAIGCGDAGVASVRSMSQIDGGNAIPDTFDCIDGSGTTFDLPLGAYTVWIEALDANENVIAQSFAQELDLFDGNPVGATFDFYTDGGFFGMTWNLTESGAPANCQTNDALSIVSTPVSDTSTFFDDIFDCVDGEGVTNVLPLDSYTLSVALIDDKGTTDTGDDVVLGTADARTEVLDLGNELNDLGNFSFDF